MIEKPLDWPQNAREARLDSIEKAVEEFMTRPGFVNREILISLVSNYDLNQTSSIGLHRITDYEVALINTLYLLGLRINCGALRAYLYEIIGDTVRSHKMFQWVLSQDGESSSYIIKAYREGLISSLRIYYHAYLSYTLDKTMSFCDHLIAFIENTIKDMIEHKVSEEYLFDFCKGYLSLLNDISFFRSTQRNGIWAFSREDIKRLYVLEARILSLFDQNPYERPQKGVLMTSISNYILKSRNGYNNDYVVKYLSSEAAKRAFDNNEIWMRRIDKLNDEREQKVIPELFEDHTWIKYDWVREIDFTPVRNYYLTCFSKSLNNKDMANEYGECIYGYKNDRLADLLAPIYKRNNINDKTGEEITCYLMGQVIHFDVLYDKEEAKEEINYLCEIIDCFEMNDNEKNLFLQEILQYWILTVKDGKWATERERRYVLFLYDDYEYIELDLGKSDTLKMKTSIFCLPDFLLGENPMKREIKEQLDCKMCAIADSDLYYCNNCLSRDYDSAAGGQKTNRCSICGSNNISLIKQRKFV